MATRLSDALAILAGRLKTVESTPATYQRGEVPPLTGSNTCTVNLTANSVRLRVTDFQGGTKIERPDLSGTFQSVELNFGDGVFEPKDGDLVTYNGKVYRLSPTNGGREPSWYYTDPSKVAIRIFAKFLRTA